MVLSGLTPAGKTPLTHTRKHTQNQGSGGGGVVDTGVRDRQSCTWSAGQENIRGASAKTTKVTETNSEQDKDNKTKEKRGGGIGRAQQGGAGNPQLKRMCSIHGESMIAPMKARALINTPVPVKLHWKRISDVVVD